MTSLVLAYSFQLTLWSLFLSSINLLPPPFLMSLNALTSVTEFSLRFLSSLRTWIIVLHFVHLSEHQWNSLHRTVHGSLLWKQKHEVPAKFWICLSDSLIFLFPGLTHKWNQNWFPSKKKCISSTHSWNLISFSYHNNFLNKMSHIYFAIK